MKARCRQTRSCSVQVERFHRVFLLTLVITLIIAVRFRLEAAKISFWPGRQSRGDRCSRAVAMEVRNTAYSSLLLRSDCQQSKVLRITIKVIINISSEPNDLHVTAILGCPTNRRFIASLLRSRRASCDFAMTPLEYRGGEAHELIDSEHNICQDEFSM